MVFLNKLRSLACVSCAGNIRCNKQCVDIQSGKIYPGLSVQDRAAVVKAKLQRLLSFKHQVNERLSNSSSTPTHAGGDLSHLISTENPTSHSYVCYAGESQVNAASHSDLATTCTWYITGEWKVRVCWWHLCVISWMFMDIILHLLVLLAVVNAELRKTKWHESKRYQHFCGGCCDDVWLKW